jgi:hypothetical protein
MLNNVVLRRSGDGIDVVTYLWDGWSGVFPQGKQLAHEGDYSAISCVKINNALYLHSPNVS